MRFHTDEHKDLAHLFGLLVEAGNSQCSSVPEMLKNPKWRRVIEVSQQLSAKL